MLNGLKLLVVDDNRDAREIYTVVLETQRAEVVRARDVDSALDALTRVRPDIVVTNLSLTEAGDAIDLLKRIRALGPDTGRWTPVILISGQELSQIDALGIRAHFDDFLRKPVDLDAFMTTIVRLAGRSASTPRHRSQE